MVVFEMRCSVLAIKTHLLKKGDVWDRQSRGLSSAAVENSKAAPSASGQGPTEVGLRRVAGCIQWGMDFRL